MAAQCVLRAALCRAAPWGRRAASGGSVPQRIEEKRRAALLGGGQSRIDAQHRRVRRGRRDESSGPPLPAAMLRDGAASVKSRSGSLRPPPKVERSQPGAPAGRSAPLSGTERSGGGRSGASSAEPARERRITQRGAGCR